MSSRVALINWADGGRTGSVGGGWGVVNDGEDGVTEPVLILVLAAGLLVCEELHAMASKW